MKNNKVIVTVPEGKSELFSLNKVDDKGKQWASVMLTQTVLEINNGILNPRKRTAFIRGDIKDLQVNFSVGQTLEGKIVIEERTTSFFEGQQPKINPQTRETLTLDGMPIYRNSSYVSDESMKDVLLVANGVGALIPEVTTGRPIPVNSNVQ